MDADSLAGPWQLRVHLCDSNRPYWVVFRIHDTCPKTLERVSNRTKPRRFYSEANAQRAADRLNTLKTGGA